MKKFIKIILILLVIFGVGGYAVWHYGTKVASEKIFEKLETSIGSEKIEELKSYAKNDPRVQEIVKDAASIDPDTLPFQTKEEATRVVIKKVGVTQLLDMKEKAENGTLSKDEVINEIEGKLSEDEITALKYVLYQELNK